MKQLLKAAVIILSIAYPFMVYWGLQHYPAGKLLPFFLVLLALRWFTGNRPGERLVLAAMLVFVIAIGYAFGHKLGLKFYPALVNLGFLILFAGSLLSPPSIVERLARMRDPELSPAGVAYATRVTWAWCFLFVFNGSLATITALWTSDEIWVLYNGFIAYLLIAALAVGEWLLRQRVVQ